MQIKNMSNNNRNLKDPIPYTPFNKFVFRTPYFLFSNFIDTIYHLEQDNNRWATLLQNKQLQEAIFIASPILYDEIQKYLTGIQPTEKDLQRLRMAVMRYYTRMSTRCTPFGLFAGISIGHWGERNKTELVDNSQYKRHTRLDMNYICSLLQHVTQLPEIRNFLNYFPNTSIYTIGDRMRYVEYYYKNAKRIHNISAVDNSIYLQSVLQYAAKGATIDELASILVNEGISLYEATEYICELIENQLLVSELEPTITGSNFLTQLSNVLKSIPTNEELKNNIARITLLLREIDCKEIGSTLSLYKDIEEFIKILKVEYEPKYLFQTDMYKPVVCATLKSSFANTIKDTILLLNKITPQPPQSLLSKFADNFYQRYEDREMPLLQVLDAETGIGYLENLGDTSPLLDGYIFPVLQQNNVEIKWNSIISIFYKKLLNAYKTNAYCIEVEEKDFDFIEPSWNDLPDTLSVTCQIFSMSEDDGLIYVHGLGGSSAANLLSRFCHLDKVLENLTVDICDFEQNFNPNVIYAEIVHLPESRIGNILLRPILRSYEIPYLGKSSVDEEYQIPLSDLFISIKSGKVLLRSKRLNKEIIPRLSTAHNFIFNAMPVYHFLCDMQTQKQRGGIGFNWGPLENEYDFLPRVQYKNSVISLAKWTIQTDDFSKILGLYNAKGIEKKKEKPSVIFKIDENTLQRLQTWRSLKQIPRYVVFPEGDNELFVDMNNMLSIKTLYSIIRKYKSFPLVEFPFDDKKSIVKNEKGKAFTNEFILGFYKTLY